MMGGVRRLIVLDSYPLLLTINRFLIFIFCMITDLISGLSYDYKT